jgi:hypothetical protein
MMVKQTEHVFINNYTEHVFINIHTATVLTMLLFFSWDYTDGSGSVRASERQTLSGLLV